MIFLFFGHPGAGKTTLVGRFAARFGVPGIDTDSFMAPAEIEAVLADRYTQTMRLANVRRYCAFARDDAYCRPHAAFADGLPNNAARRFALEQFAPGAATLVLVHADPQLWAERLAARANNIVDIGVRQAEAYIAANWEEPDPDLPLAVIENGDDPDDLAAQLDRLWMQFGGGRHV